MPIRILTALVNKITIKAFYISSAFFYFLIKLTTICFYLKRWCYTVCCKHLFYLHIVNGRTNNGFLSFFISYSFPKKNSLKFKSKLLYSLIYLLCEIILLTTFLEFSSLNKTTVFGFIQPTVIDSDSIYILPKK